MASVEDKIERLLDFIKGEGYTKQIPAQVLQFAIEKNAGYNRSTIKQYKDVLIRHGYIQKVSTTMFEFVEDINDGKPSK